MSTVNFSFSAAVDPFSPSPNPLGQFRWGGILYRAIMSLQHWTLSSDSVCYTCTWSCLLTKLTYTHGDNYSWHWLVSHCCKLTMTPVARFRLTDRGSTDTSQTYVIVFVRVFLRTTQSIAIGELTVNELVIDKKFQKLIVTALVCFYLTITTLKQV